jgi:hypothetical protein
MNENEIETPVPSTVPTSDDVFAEAFAAATGQNNVEIDNSESQETVDLQDNLPSGTEAESTEEELIADDTTEDTTSESSDSSEPGHIEEVSVKGKDGKRRNIKVDFSDKTKLKKYVQKAANSVRLQSERDALQSQVEKLEESNLAMSNLQEILDTQGFKGLIDQLNADNGGFKAWMDGELAKHEQRLHASEDELARIDAEDTASDLRKRLERMEQQQQQREEKVIEERNQAQIAKQASEINPIYFKHAFDGKLGDPVVEQTQNEVMFMKVTKTLDDLSEKGIKISPAIIEREFKSYSNRLLKSVNRKVRQNTTRAIDKKKIEATNNVQQQVRRGNTDASSIDNAMKQRDWAGSIKDLWLKGKL